VPAVVTPKAPVGVVGFSGQLALDTLSKKKKKALKKEMEEQERLEKELKERILRKKAEEEEERKKERRERERQQREEKQKLKEELQKVTDKVTASKENVTSNVRRDAKPRDSKGENPFAKLEGAFTGGAATRVQARAKSQAAVKDSEPVQNEVKEAAPAKPRQKKEKKIFVAEPEPIAPAKKVEEPKPQAKAQEPAKAQKKAATEAPKKQE
jgi:hypothetical protein